MTRSQWEPLLPGIRNARSEVGLGDWRSFASNQQTVRFTFRDRYGRAWAQQLQISGELVKDAPEVVGEFLARYWGHFKKYLERRYQETQEWVYEGLNTRSGEWKRMHEATVARWNGWSEEDIAEYGLEDYDAS